MLLNFAQSSAGKRLDADEGSRNFEGREGGTAALLERGFVKGSDDVRYGNFASYFVGDSNDGGFSDSFLLKQELLDFARVDVEAGGDDEVGSADFQCEVFVGG